MMSCYGGGDITGAVIGTFLACIILGYVIWWLSKKYNIFPKKDTNLVADQLENGASEYVFDNPAFGNDVSKVSDLTMDSKWTSQHNSMDKRKTVDDSSTNKPVVRLVPLRGSDFTGLGIELCGNLKDGIFVKKIMSQGPAANVVKMGDRITSITIDFRHIVYEDAVTILSYASPYNVQLELVDQKKPLSANIAQTPKKAMNNLVLQHPLYRSSSQSDLKTIEQNSMKQLSQNDGTNTPTLKMENSEKTNSTLPKNQKLPMIYKENEKKESKQIKGKIEEKLQTKQSDQKNKAEIVDVEYKSPDSPGDDTKKGLKFGIRVFPPAVNDKIFGKSPTKIQADNENNTNIENDLASRDKPSPPAVKKRNKDKSGEKAFVMQEQQSPSITISTETEFIRQNSINSSGIKRDAAGIPQEVPSHMMQAAMAAKDNRKSANVILDSNRKSKGKAPKPPVEVDMDASTDTIDTILSIETVNTEKELNSSNDTLNNINFSDNFSDEVFNQSINNMYVSMDKMDIQEPSNSSTPKSERKKTPSDTESQTATQDQEPAFELSKDGGHIELNSSDITVHQVSEQDNNCSEEGRRTASLGDLSKLENDQKITPGNRSNNGTLERAHSLDVSDCVNHENNSKKRKSDTSDEDVDELQENKLMTPDGLDTMHSGRLRSANEWGNLADAIYNNQDTEGTANHKTAEIIATAHNIVEDVLNTVGVNKNIVVAQEMHFTKMPSVEPLEDDDDENNSEKQKISIKSNTESDDINIYPVSTIPISGTKINIHYDDDKNEDYDTNIPDDMKVSRYPFGSLERPKSDVLKKLLSTQKIDIDSTTHVSDESSMNSKIIIGDNTNFSNDNIGEPISLTLINNSDMIENDQTESSQISPIYSSNNNGINSINISSIELNILPENNMHYYKPSQQQPNSDNIVTISTEVSQPSSITMIDDEHLDFNLQTLEDEDDEEFLKNERLLQELEFQEDLGILLKNETVKSNDSNKTNFITEITVKSITNKDNDENGSDNIDDDIIKVNNNNNNISIKNNSREISVTSLNNNIEDNGSVVHKSNIVKPTVLPRNSEIKFTTSTYESPQQQNNKMNEKRVYHIDQIRSNFEKNSEIPLPIRKSSITSSTSSLNSSSTTPITPKSPSKIPVFNSNKVSHSTSPLADNSQRSPPQYSHINHSNNNHNNSNVNINTTSNNNLNNGNNRVSVSVTSIIRNQAKHPSGRLNQ